MLLHSYRHHDMEEVKLLLNLNEGLETRVQVLYPAPEILVVKEEPKA